MSPLRWTRYDTQHTVRDAYPWLSILMAVMLFTAPVGFVPQEWLALPAWFRFYTFFVLVFFVVLGAKWKNIYPYLLARKADHLARHHTGYYEITLEEEVQLQCEHTAGHLVTFRGLGRQFFRFDDDQDRVLFVIGR